MTEAMIRKKPGMVSVKEMPVLQDGPPPGGFPPVRYARRIPTKGPSAIAIFLAAFGTFSWGMYQVGKGNKIRRKAGNNLLIFVERSTHLVLLGWPIVGESASQLRFLVILLVLTCVISSFCSLGWAIKEEKYAARRAILPLLQAEEDERFVREWKKYLEEEARIMKDVPGWKVGENVYHSGKWMPPASGELRPDIW